MRGLKEVGVVRLFQIQRCRTNGTSQGGAILRSSINGEHAGRVGIVRVALSLVTKRIAE